MTLEFKINRPHHTQPFHEQSVNNETDPQKCRIFPSVSRLFACISRLFCSPRRGQSRTLPFAHEKVTSRDASSILSA